MARLRWTPYLASFALPEPMKHEMCLLRGIVLLLASLSVQMVWGQAEGWLQELEAIRNKYHAVGLEVVAMKDGEIVLDRAFGLKSREDSIPLQPGDVYRIASVSKTFVATAIMQLVEKGKLALDDDVNRYLGFQLRNPRYPDVPITVRMLLCHRSSLKDNLTYSHLNIIDPDANPHYADCYKDYAPGTEYAYSNLGYTLLGAVIENVSHKRFDRYIKKHISRPLRLHGSFNFADQPSEKYVNTYAYIRRKDTLQLYRPASQPQVDSLRSYCLGRSTLIFSPAGGMRISASELATYMAMHMYGGTWGRKQIISPQSEQQMREIQTPEQRYALSFRHYVNRIPGERMIGQTGGAHGIHSAMFFHPEKKFGFIVICNGCKSELRDGSDLSWEVVRCMYRHLIKAD